MEDQDYILFDSYINNELSAEESLAFENRRDSDEAFAQSFRVFLDATIYLQNSIRNEAETNDFKKNLESISTNHFNKAEAVATKPQPSIVFRFAKLAMAASVVIFLGVFAFNQFSNPTYSDYNAHEPMTIVRGSVKDLIAATKAFNNKDYEKANVLLKNVLEKDPENSELQLYYAITNIELDNYKVADSQLNKIIAGESAYKDRALWYSALSRLKQKNIDATIVLLKQISEEADDYKEAQKLLDKLE
ncbi:tol-pal system YbgF family protein [uncultured Lacinutrix sp.]|uniref:tetratricopeptide repeat protein n=1 Tax=uncultured Lacinutrix sp. TaxID=574032 RepID=UPI002608D3F6|nr:tetratricopeptide repeat protein [uncultured Lacinutrix sp.]